MALNQHDQEIYDAILGSTVLSDNTLNMLRKYPDEIGYFAVKVLEMRKVLRDKIGITDNRVDSLNGYGLAIETIDVGIDAMMLINNYPEDFAIAYKAILRGQPDQHLADDFQYTANSFYNNEYSSIVYAPNRRVKPGSMNNCFNGCSHLIAISDKIDFSPATYMNNMFTGTSLLPAKIVLDMQNCITATAMGGNFREIEFKNMSRVSNISTMNYASITLRKVSGVNLSGISSASAAFSNNSNLESVEFDGCTYDSDGITITWDDNITNYFVRNAAGSIVTGCKNIGPQTLLAICDMAYDYINNPKGLNRPSGATDLNIPLDMEHKARLINIYGEARTKNYVTEKGWIW